MPENVEVELLALPKLPPVPLTTLHAPVPTEGVFAAKVTVVKPQVEAPVWSAPALGMEDALCSSYTPISTFAPKGRALPNRSVVGAPVFVPTFSTGEQTVRRKSPAVEGAVAGSSGVTKLG